MSKKKPVNWFQEVVICVVCVEYAKGTITRKEAFSALREVANVAQDKKDQPALEHVRDTWQKLQFEEKEEAHQSWRPS